MRLGIAAFVIAGLTVGADARGESTWDSFQQYASRKADEALAWAASEAEYARTAVVDAATRTYDAGVATASGVYESAVSGAAKTYQGVSAAVAPYTSARPVPRSLPKPVPDVSTGCAGDPLPSEAESTQAMTILELARIAGNLDCGKVAQVQGLATSLRPLRIPVSKLDLTPISSTRFRACKLPSAALDAAWEGATMPFKCAGNAGYGLFVDGAWGDAGFVAGLAGAAMREGVRGTVGAVPLVGDDVLHQLGMRTYGEIGEEAGKTLVATIDRASQYLGTPAGRQKLEIMMCYGTNPGFRMAADTKMLQGMSQFLIDGVPGAADKLAEVPCNEVASLGCRIGGMIGYEVLTDALLEAAAAAATATGVGAAAGAAIGVGAIAKTLGKIAVKSVEAAVELFRFMMKLIPAELLGDVVLGLKKLVPDNLYAMIRQASGLSEEGLEAAAKAAAKTPASPAARSAARADYDSVLTEAHAVVDAGAKRGSKAFEEANDRLIDRTAKHLDAQGVRYTIIEDPPGHRVIDIQQGSTGTGKQNQLNGMATGLSNVQGVSVRYDPLGMYAQGAKAGFNSGDSRLYLPDEAIREVSTTGAIVRHELTHAKTTRDVRRGRENPLHGHLSTSSGDAGAYGASFSHDEVAAFRVSMLDETMDVSQLQSVAEQGRSLAERTRDAARRSRAYLSGTEEGAAPGVTLSFDRGSVIPVAQIRVPASGTAPAVTQYIPIVGGRSRDRMQGEVVAIMEEQATRARRSGSPFEAEYRLAIDGLSTGKSRIIYSLDPASGVITGKVVFTNSAGARTGLNVPLPAPNEAARLARQLDGIEMASRDAAEVFSMNETILDALSSQTDPARKRAIEAARRHVSRKRPSPGSEGYQPVTRTLLEAEYRAAYEQALSGR